MKQSISAISRFVRDEEAATAAEYGIIAALVGGALLLAMTAFGTAIKNMFNTLSTRITSMS